MLPVALSHRRHADMLTSPLYVTRFHFMVPQGGATLSGQLHILNVVSNTKPVIEMVGAIRDKEDEETNTELQYKDSTKLEDHKKHVKFRFNSVHEAFIIIGPSCYQRLSGMVD